jgi:hypothetical protein
MTALVRLRSLRANAVMGPRCALAGAWPSMRWSRADCYNDAMRLMIYDPTCVRARGRPGLSTFWRAGATLYGSVLRRFDAWSPARSWDEALRWIIANSASEPIDEIQYWGHGKWGCALIDRDVLDERSLRAQSAHADSLRLIAKRMRAERSLLWFRTCETLGAHRGQRFARALGERLGCTVGGHTFVIGALQSGLHSLRPGASAHWDPSEGLLEGDADEPSRAAMSSMGAPHTIHCLQGTIPAGW